jgi:hypothetical protein
LSSSGVGGGAILKSRVGMGPSLWFVVGCPICLSLFCEILILP